MKNINNAKKERSGNMKKRYFDICEKCGAHLDPGEHCDCEKASACRCKRKSKKH